MAYARPIIAGSVLYESFAGNGALDNPEAIFRELLRSSDLPGLRHIWVLDHHAGRPFRAEFRHDRRVRFVTYRSARYFAALARSQYLINNATFPAEFQKRDGQVYVNTWHGTPLKTMGYDMPDGAFFAANTLRNFVSADLLLAQNPTMTRMYREAYKLDGIFSGRILETGYPRTDRQLLTESEREAARAVLRDAGIPIDGRTLVTYAPTWKGTSFTSPRDDAEALVATVDALQARLGDGYAVALKAHQAVHRMVAEQAPGRLVPNDLPTNVVLGLTDVLVTDYSSIFFDFLTTDRRIVFFTPDEEDYARERGTSSLGELPGATARTVDQLAEAILTERDPQIAERAVHWRDACTPRDDGAAARRVVDAVFRNELSASEPAPPAERRSLLLYLGGMRSNGITSSALNLLAHLDHTRFDVSILIARPKGREQRMNASRIDGRIRQFHLAGAPNSRKLVTIASRVRGRLGARWLREPRWDDRLWSSEWRRVFGLARFDSVVDFSGYSRPWAQLILHSPTARRAIWLHNDMAAEVHRSVGGRRRMRHSLPAVFSLYSRYDELVSVSRDLAVVNSDALSAHYSVPRERFTSARNVIDDIGVLSKLREPLVDAAEFVDPETQHVTVPDWARSLASHGPDTRWFITVGRLSPEKNHARLIDAFAIVHGAQPQTRLLIVGDGPLRADLHDQIASLDLADSAFLSGSLANPFPAMAAADCFVLSSNYEGQPMVLLEAAIAGLPIVTVRFGSVSDALPEGELHVVDQSVSGLAAGLTDYLDGTVGAAELDARRYNALALREFAAAVDPDEGVSDSSSIDLDTSASKAMPRRSRTKTATRATAATTIHHI
jgi:CDP-glycerol glycerophosphotransferase (TagB/SpsB family)/glycosyltransferase involved in cell wall biosynthesis